MMHKEVVARKRTHVIAITLILLTCMIYLYQGLKALNTKNLFILEVCNFIVILLTIAFIIKEYTSCKILYKYAIIGDKFIINKVYKNEEENLQNIRVDDIIYIGKKNNIPKEFKSKCIGSYACDIFGRRTYCCIYKKDDRLVRFNFGPSESLIKRLMKCNKALNIG